jgi:hypothetical protein
LYRRLLKEVDGMKPVIQFVRCGNGGPAWNLSTLLRLADTANRALRYCLAAQRDEKNEFPFTAAMEWQKAAGLCAAMVPVADLCWRQWERIVQLPRQMAEPIADPLQRDARTSQHLVVAPAENQLSLLISA